MGKILLIEDNGILADEIKKELGNEHEIVEAYSYITAIGAWRKNNEQFDCIILDLDIKTDGLEEDEIKNHYRTHGILVLEKFCKGKEPDQKKEIWEKTIVYSAYTDKLEGKEEMKNAPSQPILIPKGPNSIFKLVREVKKIIDKK